MLRRRAYVALLRLIEDDGDVRAAFVLAEDTQPATLAEFVASTFPDRPVTAAQFNALSDGFALWREAVAIAAIDAAA